MKINVERHKKAPIFDALVEYHRDRPIPFHVPGHKMGRVFDEAAQRWFQPLLGLDATEVRGLDDLHNPEGAIREAQELAAELFRAEKTHFLIGGSTVGNIAMIMTVCRPGDHIIVQRNVHKSVINGIILARANPVFITPRIDEKTGVAASISARHLEQAVRAYPDAKGIFITNPNYYGMGTDLHQIVRIAQEYGMPLLVDEAHGAHFGFHPDVPFSAMDAGADMAVQSTHKMLPAMTMSSMLHVQGKRIDRNRLSQVLSMIQSSSPSYPLMASLDLARRDMALYGVSRINDVLAIVNQAQNWMDKHVTLFQRPDPVSDAYETLDPLKITLHTGSLINGFQLQSLLEEYQCVAEMADRDNVVLSLSPGTSREDMDRLLEALKDIETRISVREAQDVGKKEGTAMNMENVVITSPERMPAEVMDSGKEPVKLVDSAGRICAESVIPYPPGVPVLIPGERIEPKHIEQIQNLKQAGAYFQGIQNRDMPYILVTEA